VVFHVEKKRGKENNQKRRGNSTTSAEPKRKLDNTSSRERTKDVANTRINQRWNLKSGKVISQTAGSSSLPDNNGGSSTFIFIAETELSLFFSTKCA